MRLFSYFIFFFLSTLALTLGCARDRTLAAASEKLTNASQIKPLVDLNLQLIYTPSPAGHAPFIQAIQNAKSVEMTMFHLTDPNVINALVAAKKKHASVQVIVDGKLDDKTQQHSFTTLQNAGITVVKSSPAFSITHMKAMVIDGKTAFITAMNMTTEFATTRDFGVITEDSDIITEMHSVFVADLANAAHHTKKTPPLSVPSLIWSPVDSQSKLSALIASATTTILATTETLEDPTIEAALITAAKNKNVSVRLIVPECVESPKATMDFPSLRNLATGGSNMELRVMPHPYSATTPYMHSKMLVIDGKVAYVGSINFSNDSTLKARELGVIFSNNDAIVKMQTIFESDWDRAIAVPTTLPRGCPG
jgi:cardiolipin synthase A/B